MAPKKPTMLQRQRALRQQQQRTKQQSSKQLPPKGQTSANSRQARGQRTSTAKAQAANQQRVIARGMEGFVRRGQAMDKLDRAAQGTQGSGTRTAGAGGGLAKRPSSAVNQRQSGKPATSGGRIQQSSAGRTSSTRVEPVRVRDLGSTKPNQMGGGAQRALPAGRTGGALARTGGTSGGAARAAASAGRGLLGKAAVPLAIAGEVSAMMDRNRRWNDYKERSGMNEKTPAQTGGTRRGAAAGSRTRSDAKPTKPPLSSTGVRTAKGNTVATGSPEYNRYRQQQLDDNKRRNASVRDTTPTRQSSSSTGGGNSSPSRSSGGGSASRSSAPRSQAPSAPRFTGTVEEGRQKWAEKYSSSKYDGQAIQKEAKKLMDEMKKRKEDKSNASKAGWDGNKNY